MQVSPPEHDEVIAALIEFPSFDGTLAGVRAKENEILVLVRHPRFPGLLAVPFPWPDKDLTGPSTGESCQSLPEWVREVGWVLNEGLGATALKDVDLRADPGHGYSVVRLVGGSHSSDENEGH